MTKRAPRHRPEQRHTDEALAEPSLIALHKHLLTASIPSQRVVLPWLHETESEGTAVSEDAEKVTLVGLGAPDTGG